MSVIIRFGMDKEGKTYTENELPNSLYLYKSNMYNNKKMITLTDASCQGLQA